MTDHDANVAPLIRKVDCVRLPVSSIEEGLAFYRDALGHQLLWQDSNLGRVGDPRFAHELVLQTEGDPPDIDLEVESVPAAVARIQAAGGQLLSGPFEIAIGLCAVVVDAWANRLVLLDTSKGLLRTDRDGNVVTGNH